MAKKKKKEQASWASTYLKNREKEAKAYATKANQRQLANDIIASNDDELARYSTQGLTSQAKWKNDQLENDAVNLRRKYSDRQVRSYVADTNNNLTAQEENLDSINRFYRTLPLEQKARSLGYSNGLQYATYGRGLNQLKNDAYTMNMNRIQQKYDGKSYMDLLGAKAEKNNDDEASYLSQRKNQIPKAEKQKELDRIDKELQGEADVVKDIEVKASKNLISPEQVDSMYEESQKKSATLREQKSAIEADLQTDEKIANTKKQSEYYEKLRNSSDFEKNKSYKSDDSVLGDIANGVLGFMREGDFHKVIGGEADPITISKDENLYLAANNMTSDQKDMYNYLYNTKGKEEADKYVTTIQDQINYDTAKEIESDLRDNPLGKYAYAAITAPGNTIENIKSIMNGAVSDTPRPTAQNKYFSQIARENMGTAEKLGYDIVENTANMTIPILASAVTGGTAGAVLGAGLTGASAGGETFNQAWKEGYSKEQAAAYGALSGASEAGLQYVLGGITKLGGKVSNGVVNRVASKVDNAIGQAVIKQVGSSASEFTEEYLQDVIDPVFRNVVFGEDNEVKFFSTDALYSGILGALTAGVMEAPSNVTSALYERNAYRKIGQSAEQTQIADSIVETANNSNDTSVKKALETYNENETSYNLGKLRLATDNDIASPISNATNAEEVQQAYEEVITNNQSQYARNIAKEASYDKLMELGQPDYAKIYQPESLENLSEATQYDSLPDTEDFAEDISDYAITEEDTVVPTKTSKHFVAHDSKGQQIDIAEVSSLENGKESYVTADGNTVPMNTVQLDNVEQQRLINQSIKLVGNDVNGLNTMVKNFTPDIQSEYGEGAYFSAIQHFYHAGKTGKISINTMLDKYNTRNLPGNVLREAYNAGIDYAKVENKVSEPTKNSKAKLNDDTYVYYEKGQVRTTNDTIIRDLKEEEHEPVNDLLRLISKKTGITTEATKAKSEVNGYFDKASGNIVVNVLNGKGIQTSIHELGEFTLAWNRKGMEDVQSAIANWYAESKGYASLDDALTKYQETYEKYEGEKTYQSALDEFVNDAMSGLFTDEKSMKEFLLFLDSDGVEVTKRAGILDRLLEIYDKIVSKIKEYLDKSTLSDVARNTAEMELEKQAEIRQLIYDAINQASENYKNAEDTSSTAVKKQFSLDTPVEETKDLIAIHNIFEDQFMKILDIGGFAAPSIAVIRKDMTHATFGEISVVFGKDTIDPMLHQKNKIFRGDAWTETVPKGVEVKTPVELLKALRVEMDEYTAYTNFESAVNNKATYGALNEVRRDKSRLKDSIDSLHEHRRERAMSSTLMQIAIELNGKEKSYTTMEDLVNITELGSDKEMLAKLQETYPHASMKTINDLNALRKTILESDVPYFEAKPYRVINFKEIKNIVIPETASNELKNKLESLALHYVEYTDTADRMKKVNDGNFAFSVDVDLRKSLDVNANATMDLLKENEQLKKANELLKQEFKLTHGCIPNRNSVDVIASKLIRECKSTYSKDKLADRISKLFTYAHKHNSQNDEVLKIMTEILKPVADQSTITDSSMSVQYKGFKDYLRNKGIRLSDEQKSEIGNSIYDSYDEFRKKNFGSIKTRNDGTYLEQEWADLCEDYKGLLDPNEPVSSMPEALLDALDTIKPIFMNGKNAESMAYDMALSAFDMYFNIKPIETYADKNLKKLNSIRNEYKANVKKLKQKYGEYVTRYYKEMADKNNNIRSELSKARAQAAYNKKLRNEMVERKKSGQIQKEKREIIRSTRRVVDRLMKKAITPTDKRHIPEPLLKSIVDLGSALDFFDSDKGMNASNLEWMETEKKLLKLQTELKNIDSEAEGYEELSLGFDPDIIGKVNEFVSNINTTKNINDMTIQELRLFNEAINAISKCITEADILHSNELFNRVSDIGKSTLDEFMFMNNKKDLNPILEKFNTLLNVNMLDSRSFFHRLGKSAESVYKSIRKGFDVWVGRFEESQKYMNEVVDPKECKSWSDGSVVLDCQTSSGKMQMTPAQLMNLYVLYKRPQAREHILRGGFSVTAINHKLQRKTFHIDVSSLRSNFDKLTDRQKEVAEKMQNYLASECSDWGNETSMTLYGYKKFTDVDYFPIKVKKDTTTVNSNNQENTQAGFYSIKNMGASKNVVEGAMNPLEIADIFDVFTNHVVEMANYNAYALPLLDAMKWYGYKEIDTKYDEDSRNVYSPLNDEMKHNGLYDVLANKDRTSFKYYNTVRSEIGRVYGNNMRAYFEEFIKSVNGSAQISNDEEFSHMLLSLWKPARVGANIRVAIQQPTAYCRAAMVMDPKYLLKAIPIATKNKVKGRSAADIAEDNSAIAKWKSWGYYDTMIGRSFKEIITGQHTTLNKIRDKSMVLAEKGDRMTWGTIWTACELEVKDNHPELDSDEFTEAVKNRFDEVIDKTQVVDSILHRSKLMRSKSGLVKLETAFMAEHTKSYNMLLNTLHDTYRNGFSEATKKKVARAVAVFTFTGVVNAMAQSLVDVLRDDDKEYWETVLDNASSNVNPLSLIPWIKNLVTIVQGYDVGRSDVEALSSVMETANKLTDIVEKISNGEFEVNFTSIYSLANTLLKAISDVTGLPIQNVSRDAFAVASKFNEKGRLRKYIAKYDYDNLYESLVDDNKEEIKKYRDKLEKNGKTNKEIEDAIRKRLSDDSEEIEKAASLRKSGDIDGYMKILNELKKKGFSQDTLVKAVNSLMVEKKDTSKATEPSKVDAISNRDLIIAVENGKDIDKVISMIADQCEGKTDKEIRSKLKSILTNNYKKQYEAAKSPSEKIAIKNKLYKIGYKGQLYTGKDFARWDKK